MSVLGIGVGVGVGSFFGMFYIPYFIGWVILVVVHISSIIHTHQIPNAMHPYKGFQSVTRSTIIAPINRNNG